LVTSEDPVALSRRDFCRIAGCAGLAIATGCVDGGAGAIQTGKLGDSTGGGPDGGGTKDGSTHVTDAASGVACTTTPTDVGAPSGYSLNAPQYFSSGRFFVVKDSGGFYALTALCTHEGAVTQAQTSQFYCPRHGATFDFNGNPTGGPVFTGLVHYAMCNMSNGHLGVITSMQVSQSARIA
jgi:nitrite reductase/ring-hydroxylating ferredoxin subunit